ESHHTVVGVAHFRGEPLTIVDLAVAVKRRSLLGVEKKLGEGSVIVTEFNRVSVGFWVADIDRIVVKDWTDIRRPSKGTSASAYVNGIAEIDDKLVQILDVEKVLSETISPKFKVQTSLSNADIPEKFQGAQILVVDDSSIARKHVCSVLESLGLNAIVTRDGKEALDLLNQWHEEGVNVSQTIPLVVSDIEMPEMDGYTLTHRIRENTAYQNMYVILHTSLSGAINPQLAGDVGANNALSKFDADDLAHAVVEGLKAQV
ncbi:MAG: response regulator, partial [Gammaproteobacteria bacterium]|nr:response regulator [Gammaproteobacteria bacterium]